MKLTIVMPVFNEKRTVTQAIREAQQLKIDKEIIIVDNYSTDGTVELLKKIKEDTDNLQIIFQPKNFGSGVSHRVAVSLAKGEYIYSHHADLEYDINDVYKMLEKAERENLDAVFGSRIANYHQHSNFTLIKERPYTLATLVSTYLVNKWYHKNFSDIIGTKLVKTSVLRQISWANNQGAEFEIASRLSKRGCKIGEIPISYKPRSIKEGKKVGVKDAIPALLSLIKVRYFD